LPGVRYLVLLGAIALAGCGSDGGDKTATTSTPAKPPATTPARGTPRPAEPAELAVARLAKARRAGDCSAPAKLFGHPEITPKDCKRLLPTINLVLPPDVKTYGSGAVATDTDGGKAILALDSDRRFKYVTSFSPSYLAKAPAKNADEVMSAVVSAIRSGDCHQITTYSLTYSNGGSGKQFCALEPVRQLHAALNRAYTASPTRLGGDGTFVFYGLKVKPHYFTLLFLASKNGSFYFVTSARA
jgi:hypothetical protein